MFAKYCPRCRRYPGDYLEPFRPLGRVIMQVDGRQLLCARCWDAESSEAAFRFQLRLAEPLCQLGEILECCTGHRVCDINHESTNGDIGYGWWTKSSEPVEVVKTVDSRYSWQQLVQDFVHQELRRVCAVFVEGIGSIYMRLHVSVRSGYLSRKAVFSASTGRTTIGTARGISIRQVGRAQNAVPQNMHLSPWRVRQLVKSLPGHEPHLGEQSNIWFGYSSRRNSEGLFAKYLSATRGLYHLHPPVLLATADVFVSGVGIDEESMEVE